MKIKYIACAAALLLASLSATQASVITSWTFDNLPIGFTPSPAPSNGVGVATALGMDNTYPTPGTSTNISDVQSNPGGSVPSGPNTWRVRGGKNTATAANGWSSLAPIGTQGAQFKVSTAGYYGIHLTCDVDESAQGEQKLMFQYTTDGVTWNLATNITAGTLGALAATNSANTVSGIYYKLASGFDNAISVDFSQIPACNNNTNFAVRMVNAATGFDCVNAAGTALNNSSGNWNFDNVIISGVAPTTFTEWTFESESNLEVVTPSTVIANPVPEIGSGMASALGMTTSYIFQDANNSVGSVSSPDVLSQVGSSTGPSGPDCWRVRGQNPGNGWDSQAPIGAQGAEFDVSTANYSSVLLKFDMYFTTQGEAKFEVLYTTDGWVTSNNAAITFAQNTSPTFTNSTYIYTNGGSINGGSDNTCVGSYFYQTNGQGWFNGITVDLTGVSSVTNNPNFGFRIVNAATGADVLNPSQGSYNNSSGNWRFDNVTVLGQFSGPAAPTITADPNATVDHPFTNTFPATPGWQYTLTNITVNGSTLPTSAYNTNISGKVIFTPSASTMLQTAGTNTIVYRSSGGYIADTVLQYVGPGVATQIGLVGQPSGPSGNGGTLVYQPAAAVLDQYGNGTTNPYVNVTFTASASSGWTLGGGTAVATANGVASFTNLSATVNGSSAVSGAYITLTASAPGFSITPAITNTTTFNIAAPSTPYTPGNLAVLQIDSIQNNTTFSIVELNPNASNQTVPVNINPITATGTNGMRLSSAGSTGRLSISADGTELCFAGFVDQNSLTPDETFNLSRAAGTLNYTNGYTVPILYSVTVSSSQARDACTLDDTNFVIADKNGIFIDAFNWAVDNTRSVKAFGGTMYLMSATSPKPAVYAMSDTTPSASAVFLPGVLADGKAQDFYMAQSGANGTNYDLIYIMDQNSATSGTINKYSDVGGTWTPNGNWTSTNGGDGIFAMTNNTGGINLYYTSGGGGTGGNSVIEVTDTGGFNGTINITATNTIYTAPSTVSLKGLVIAPMPTNAVIAVSPILPINITPGSLKFIPAGGGLGATPSMAFAFTNVSGLSFSVRGTNNITAPHATWPVLGQAVESPAGSGSYSFTNTAATNASMFYILSQP